MTSPLEGLVVAEVAAGIPGGYCGKLLADAGADVFRVELERPDPESADEPSRLAALRHAYLNCSKGTVSPDRESLYPLLRRANIVLAGLPEAAEILSAIEPELRKQRRASVLLWLSPFGRSGPWVNRPATELTLQALCGSAAFRGLPDAPPIAVGGSVGDYLTGAWAAAVVLAAWRRAARHGCCEVADLSQLEVMTVSMQAHEWLHTALMGLPTITRSLEVPSVETAKDGYVGLTIMTPAQWAGFCEMIERPELAHDPELSHTLGRWTGRSDVDAAVGPWLAEHGVDDVVKLAAQHRVPATKLGNGASITGFDHFRARGLFVGRPDGCRQPRPPWITSAAHPRSPGARPETPALLPAGEGPPGGQEPPPDGQEPPPAAELPLAGLRVVDLTTFVAGPALTGFLAAMGADVVKVESVNRPDGLRLVVGPRLAEPHGWEYSWAFQGCNVNKRSITLDLGHDAGRELLLRLAESADVVIENFSPHVLPQLGLDWEVLHQRNHKLVLLRMPAFGLDGPWRDRGGFAQTMEMLSGMAWITGLPDGPPVLPRGPVDFAAAIHGGFAALVALHERDRRGTGLQVEVPMIEVALNLTAEQLFAYDQLGVLLQRQGNRGAGAPQNIYCCAGDDAWIAVAIVTDDQWAGLRQAIGDPEWARPPELAHSAERRRQHDLLDQGLSDWLADKDAVETADRLCAHGVPAAPVVAPPDVTRNVQLRARGFFERLVHPISGPNLYAGLPVRLERGPGRWNRTPPPTFGQHNREVLLGELAVDPGDWERYRQAGIVGETPNLG
jgi:crotonobetainyl-CoA:carnitine CoA-transferase CaiB-like acyl-CoA transferase